MLCSPDDLSAVVRSQDAVEDVAAAAVVVVAVAVMSPDVAAAVVVTSQDVDMRSDRPHHSPSGL